MLTRQNYEAISKIVKDLVNNEGNINRDDLVEHLSDYFERNNLNFDRDKFYKACYGKEKK